MCRGDYPESVRRRVDHSELVARFMFDEFAGLDRGKVSWAGLLHPIRWLSRLGNRGGTGGGWGLSDASKPTPWV